MVYARVRLNGLVLLLFATCLLPAAVVAQSSQEAALDRFRERIRADVAEDGIGGITAAVVLGNRVVWAEGFGWADRENRVRAGVQTIYRTGSISKSFTAVALMQAVERARAGLDDPLVLHLPAAAGFAESPSSASTVTLRELASHTSGLIREPRLADAASGPIEGWEERVLSSIPETAFDTVPGARYAYSNIGFGILGLAVSRARGIPFMELVSREIFDPLGMGNSMFVVPPERMSQLAVGYANSRDGSVDRERPAAEHRGRGYKVPNGGIYSTVGDLARFMAGMTGASGDTMLGDAARRQMMRVQTPESETEGYGLGFSVRETPDGVRLVGHGGSVAGYTAYLLFAPDSGDGVILLRNYNQGRTNLGAAASELLLELVAAGRAATNGF